MRELVIVERKDRTFAQEVHGLYAAVQLGMEHKVMQDQDFYVMATQHFTLDWDSMADLHSLYSKLRRAEVGVDDWGTVDLPNDQGTYTAYYNPSRA